MGKTYHNALQDVESEISSLSEILLLADVSCCIQAVSLLHLAHSFYKALTVHDVALL